MNGASQGASGIANSFLREVAKCVSALSVEKDAETEEHVIPKWLQKHFDLFDQRLALWNGTTIPYRQTVVPACLACNRDRFAPLEKRVREGSASRRDFYLWQSKLLTVSGIEIRAYARSNCPQAGPLLPDEIAKDIEELARHAFQGVDRREFRFSPEPFGSVILLDTDSDEFVFIDVPRPYRAVAIALPNKRHLVVLPGDRGVIATMYRSRRFKKSMQLEFPGRGWAIAVGPQGVRDANHKEPLGHTARDSSQGRRYIRGACSQESPDSLSTAPSLPWHRRYAPSSTCAGR